MKAFTLTVSMKTFSRYLTMQSWHASLFQICAALTVSMVSALMKPCMDMCQKDFKQCVMENCLTSGGEIPSSDCIQTCREGNRCIKDCNDKMDACRAERVTLMNDRCHYADQGMQSDCRRQVGVEVKVNCIDNIFHKMPTA